MVSHSQRKLVPQKDASIQIMKSNQKFIPPNSVIDEQSSDHKLNVKMENVV